MKLLFFNKIEPSLQPIYSFFLTLVITPIGKFFLINNALMILSFLPLIKVNASYGFVHALNNLNTSWLFFAEKST